MCVEADLADDGKRKTRNESSVVWAIYRRTARTWSVRREGWAKVSAVDGCLQETGQRGVHRKILTGRTMFRVVEASGEAVGSGGGQTTFGFGVE